MAGLFDIFSSKNAQDAATAQKAGLTQGYGQASDLLGQGRDALTTNYSSALQPFLQNYSTASAGTKSLTDALGITGDPAQVQARFQNTPGYQFQLDQGNENVLRNASRTGTGNSGAVNLDLQKQGQGLANTTYQNYVNNLMPFLGAGNAAAAGGAGVSTGLGTQLAGSFGNQASAAYGTSVGVGNADANADLAKNNASANIWGLGQNLLKLPTSTGANPSTVAGSLGSWAFSDERLKEDIEPVGELFDGQSVYRYRYKGDDTPHIGLIAQEVEERNPDAVREFGGFKAVDYHKATEYASKLSHFLEAA